MRVIAKRTLREFWDSKSEYRDSEEPLSAWYTICKHATWQSPSDVKADIRSASFVKDKVVFNIAGNKYRVIVKISYRHQAMFIKFVGTHKQYDNIDVGSL